ncbi:sodium:solute symporter family protein [Serratia rubidaea]|uniref:Na(+)/glucose symporter n=1 Tax=Serratia rubidaea TaxID=61652 RepID=A0A3S5AQ47_SERRU|nr:sodium:solute symporter family protein [Serratia rubidaea]MBH1929613.1 sodium:solute symporter family protein [Serratia rubidaea]MDC6118362.1 sodium:solute symporter family protein [Serratia rubidaea]MEB7585246.1 sodium:solute symporter family protein [Serratia rubidaea]VEI68236.1 Na(+)/glucose symporter [Serratia rubidaea]
MEHNNFLIWFLLYAFVMMAVGWYVTRHQKTGEDFILGGRKLPMLLTLGSTVGTMVGTGSSIGAVSFGYTNGWAGMLYGIGGATGILLTAWLFGPVRKLRFMTMSEEICYYTGGSRVVKNLVALLIFLASIGWLGAHILGGGLYLAWAADIDITVAKIIIAVGFIFYVGIGGYKAVSWIDTLQSIVLFVGFIVLAALSVSYVGGWDTLVANTDPQAFTLFGIGKLGLWPALSLAIVIGIGVLATPSYRQRIYSAASTRSIRQSFVITGLLYMGFSFLPAIIGMATHVMNPALENPSFAFLFATNALPAALAMVVLIAGMSANLSSGSSDAIAGVSIILRDIYTMVTGKMPPPEKAINLSRIFLLLVILLALIFALTSNDIIGYITKMISMIMSGMCVTVLLGKFWLRFNWQGCIAALLGGSLTSLTVILIPAWSQALGNPVIPALLVSLFAAVVVTLLTPKNKLSREEVLQMITDERETTHSDAKPIGPLAGENK